MKNLVLISVLLLVAFNGWGYSESDWVKFKTLNHCKGCDLSGVNLSEADLSDVDLSEADLSGANLSEADLSEADLRGANLSGADLRGANLGRYGYGTPYKGANLSGANLSGADLRGAKLYKTEFSEADLRGANLSGNLSGGGKFEFLNTNFSSANLSGANLRDSHFSHPNFSSANLSDAKMEGSLITNGNLEGANLSGVTLLFSIIKNSHLDHVDLSGAKIVSSVIWESPLCEADLTGAGMRGVNLEGSDLSGANLTNADFSGKAQIFSAEKWLHEGEWSEEPSVTRMRDVKLDGAKYCNTKMPWGVVNDNCEKYSGSGSLGAQVGQNDHGSEVFSVYFQSVSANSAAEEAGLQERDVIVSVDGHEVGTANDVDNVIGMKKSGESFEIVIQRDINRNNLSHIRSVEEMVFSVTLKNLPVPGCNGTLFHRK